MGVQPPSRNPNFPLDLDIHPSTNQTVNDSDSSFGLVAQELAIRHYGIAGRVWEAAYAMISYIHPAPNLLYDPPIIDASAEGDRLIMLEVGSGSGLVASTLAGLLRPGHDRLIVTDLPEVYFPELLGPLLRTLLHITTPPFVSSSNSQKVYQPSIFMSYKIRSLSKETIFWSAFGLWFDFRPVLVLDTLTSGCNEWNRFGNDDNTYLFVAHRRHESYKWKIPPLDEDLLGGLGAWGTDSRKGDDTFENLLLMSLEQD